MLKTEFAPAAGPPAQELLETLSLLPVPLALLNEGGQILAANPRFRRLQRDGSNFEDFDVISAPLARSGQPLTLLLLWDASKEKRRQALERAFLHDILNTASGLRVLAGLLGPSENKAMINELIDNLIEEIQHHRKFIQAENAELEPERASVEIKPLLNQVASLFRDRTRFAEVPNITVQSDPVLLRRVLCNLIKNAVEASPPGGIVTVWCEAQADTVEFFVHNSGRMPETAQRNLFQRPFSTKAGTGRGLGAYSVKLLVEKYLQGRVWFRSDDQQGTVFAFEIHRFLGDKRRPKL